MFELEKYIGSIMEELHGAKGYAIKYVECKNKGDSRCAKYKEMAEQELQHAKNFYEFALDEYAKLNNGKVPSELPREMDEAQRRYAEQTGSIKYMLSL